MEELSYVKINTFLLKSDNKVFNAYRSTLKGGHRSSPAYITFRPVTAFLKIFRKH